MGRNVINVIKTEIYQSSAKHVQKISLVCLSSLHAAGARAAAHAERVGGMRGNIFTKERSDVFKEHDLTKCSVLVVFEDFFHPF